MLMPLSFRERLTMLIPPSVFYRQRIAQEARTGEPELAVLAELVPRGGLALDVGPNLDSPRPPAPISPIASSPSNPTPNRALDVARSRRGARGCALRRVRPWDLVRPAFGPGGAPPPRRQPEAKSRPVSQHQEL